MKNKLVFMLLPISSMLLTSCGTVMKYEESLDKYVYAMKFHEKFNVC